MPEEMRPDLYLPLKYKKCNSSARNRALLNAATSSVFSWNNNLDQTEEQPLFLP